MENENLQNDIEAIEEEKQEYLENNPEQGTESPTSSAEASSNERNSEEIEEETEEVEVEEMEFSLTENEINEWLSELLKLKEEKGSIELDVDDENSLKINYEEDSVEDSE